MAENACLEQEKIAAATCPALVLAGHLESCKGLASTTDLRKIKIKPLMQCLILCV